MSTSLILRLGTAVLLTTTLAGQAAALTSLGGLKLAAPLNHLRISEDGTTGLALLTTTGGDSPQLQVIDTTDPHHPKAAGALAVPSIGTIALSGSGKLALLHLPAPLQEFDHEAVQTVMAIDLSDRHAPRVLWQQSVSAGKVALSSQADAFAYTRRVEGKDREWEIVIVSSLNRGLRAVVPYEGASLTGRMVLSPHGRHLALVDSYQVRIWNLVPATPVLFEQALSFVARFAPTCEPLLLESGHVVIADDRLPRLSVYEAATGVPRVAKLNIEGASCNALNPNARDGVFNINDANGQISVLDLQNPSAPRSGFSWPSPAGTTAVAAANGVLFTTADRSDQLSLFRLDPPGLPAVDWIALNKVHRSTMPTVHSTSVAGSTSLKLDATRALEDAGALSALTAPVDGISNRHAAAILNDYALLAWQTGRPRGTVESALRRAIAIDPARSLAHLNLADFLRADLGRYAATGGETSKRMQEIAAQYRAHVASGAKPSKQVSSFLKGDPSAGAKSDCHAIALWTNAGRLKELVSDLGTDLRWKGRRIDLFFTTEGTANFSLIGAFDSTTDQVLDEASREDFENVSEKVWGRRQMGLLTLHGRHHFIQYKDWNHPVETKPLDGGKGCSLVTSSQSSVVTRRR